MARRWLDGERIEEIVRAVIGAAEQENAERAWDAARPLLDEQGEDSRAALAVARLLEHGAFDRERGLEAAGVIFEAHRDEVDIVSELGDAFESLHDIEFLNAAPPGHPLFAAIAGQLQRLVERADAAGPRRAALGGLATAARVLGRTWDPVAERAYLELAELEPDGWPAFYGLGLFYKTRGRFGEAQAANERALELGGADRESVHWNLGICATGARGGQAALLAWQRLGFDVALGRFGLPEGRFPSVKVRLAERPIAERDPARQPDDPGAEETIWIERLSPCHGIVRSALYQDEIGVDFGDVILFDGAPITHQRYGDSSVPVFPHLATLERPGYRRFRFAGTQPRAEQIAALSTQLPQDSVLYVHSEQFIELCSACWSDPDRDHAEHRGVERHVVTGKLCAPPTVSPRDLLAALDGALAGAAGVRVFAPDLAAMAGDADRASVERRRVAMLAGS